MITGTKVQVWNGTADRTPGGLTHADLMRNKRDKVVSKISTTPGRTTTRTAHAQSETRQDRFLQFLAPILGSLLGSILTSSNSGRGLDSAYRQHQVATVASHLDAAMRSGRFSHEHVRRAAAAVAAHRGRGAGLLSLLGIKTPLSNVPIIGSILG